jgi:hypothetical protein
MDEAFNNGHSSNTDTTSDTTTIAKPLSLVTLNEKIKEVNNIEARRTTNANSKKKVTF